MSTDDLDTARAFGLAGRVAELEDKLAKLRHYHFSTLLTLATFVDPKTGDRVFVAKEAANDDTAPAPI